MLKKNTSIKPVLKNTKALSLECYLRVKFSGVF